MTESYSRLKDHFHKLAQLSHALTFLQWDQSVMMPPGGNTSRAKAIAELSTIYHNLLTAPEIGDLIDEATIKEKNSDHSWSLQEMAREYNRAVCLPEALVKAQSLAGSKCEHEWRIQRKKNDWNGFLQNFKEVVRLAREEVQARCDSSPGKFPTPYDSLLELYCTGDSSSFISSVFNTLKKELPLLVQQIVEKQKNDALPEIHDHYPLDAQKQLNRKLMKALGFDFEKGRIDVSAHPFSTGSRGDQRITTRFRETDFLDALQATAHETGHAAYESGLPEDYEGMPAGKARNMCIHESQSLLFEKQIFLSRSFISFFTPTIHTHLPQLQELNAESIWTAATRVQPSFIRVEADEVTYPLHVILRYEIESNLINGFLEAEDIPDVWDEKMKEYLGLSTVGNFTNGCLQDIHWTDGSFGYFPSYTIGALNSAQLFNTLRNRFSDWQERLAVGEVDFIRSWLKEAIWSRGSTMESQDIISSATGETTNPDFFLNHIQQRYLEKQY